MWKSYDRRKRFFAPFPHLKSSRVRRMVKFSYPQRNDMPNVPYISSIFNDEITSNATRKVMKSVAQSASRKRITKRLFFGLLAIVLGFSTLIIQPNKILRRIKLTFTEGGELFGFWLRGNVDLLFKVHVFNITNKEAFLEGKEKLRVEEVGPYIYQDLPEHRNPQFNHTDGTVTTSLKYFFEWIPERNTRKEEDVLMLPNIAMLLFAQQFSGKLKVVNMFANVILEHSGRLPIEQQSVKDLLKGAQDPYTSLGYYFTRYWIKFKHLALLEQISGTTEDTCATHTGEKDYNLCGRMVTYNNSTYLPHWEAPCNRLAGATDGRKFGNNISPDETLYLYHRTFCRTFPLARAGSPTVSEQWLPTVPYKFRDDAFDNGEINSKNKCFCTDGRCLPTGLVDIGPCFYGFPLALSRPHFYKGDPSLIEQIDGLKPDETLHDSIWNMNTESGLLTNCSFKIQLNIVLGNLSDMSRCDKFSNLVIPVMWCEVTFSKMNPESALRLYVALQILPVAEKLFALALLFAGTLLVVRDIRETTKKKRAFGVKTIQKNSKSNESGKRLLDAESGLNDKKRQSICL